MYSLEITITRPVQRYEWGRREPRNNRFFPPSFSGDYNDVCVGGRVDVSSSFGLVVAWSSGRLINHPVLLAARFRPGGRFWFPVGCSPPPPGRLASDDWRRRRRRPIDASHCCWLGPDDERMTTTWWWPFVGSANARYDVVCPWRRPLITNPHVRTPAVWCYSECFLLLMK